MTDRDIEATSGPPVKLVRDKRRGPTRGQRQRRSAAALIVALAVLGGIGAVTVVGGRKLIGSLAGAPADYKGDGAAAVSVVIPNNASAAKIGEVLKTAGVVKSAAAFAAAARADERAKTIQPGSYQLKKTMSAKAALVLLLDPKSRVRGRVTIPEGKKLSEILDIIAKKSKIPRKDLQDAADKPASLGLPAYAEGHVEGFLFPATYDIFPDATATSVLTTMVDRFEQEAMTINLVALAKKANVTPLQAVIVASMIERETKYEEEGPKIARVIYNRIAKQQPLQIDATVQYLLPKQKEKLLNEDLKFVSPYNTYLHVGLPPGAISSPGTKSLLAALEPEAGTWRWYVVTSKDGHHEFADTEKQFLILKAKGKAATAP